MKQLRSTVLLLVVAALFGGYIYFNERGPIVQEGAVVLFKMDAARVAKIRLEDAGGGSLELQRGAAGWNVAPSRTRAGAQSGVAVPADDMVVQPLLDGLQSVQSSTLAEGGAAKLKEFGLDKPVAKVTVDSQSLAFGSSPAFDKSQIYAMSGDKVGLVPTALADNARKSFEDWRDKNVLRFKTEDVTEFSISAPQSSISLTKQDDKWSLVKPIAATADANAVVSFLSTLSTTQAAGWLDEKPANLAKFGLDHPLAVVQVGAASLKVGEKSADGYAAQNSLSPVVFKIPASLWTQLDRPLKQWRDKQVASFAMDEVTGIGVTYGGQTKSLVKVDEKWQLAGEKPDEKVNQAALDLLSNALGWTVQDFVDKPLAPASYGLDKPRFVLSLTGESGQTLKVGTASGKVYVDSGSVGVLEVLSSAFDGIKPAMKTLLPKTPFTLK